MIVVYEGSKKMRSRGVGRGQDMRRTKMMRAKEGREEKEEVEKVWRTWRSS